MHRRNSTKWKTKKIFKIKMNLLERSRPCSAIKARQQIFNRRSKHSSRTRSILPIS